MKIIIQTSQNEEHELQAQGSDTVGSIKSKIEFDLELGVVTQQCLSFEGNVLQDHKTLSASNVKENDVLNLTMKKTSTNGSKPRLSRSKSVVRDKRNGFYQLLGVPRDADAKEIRRAYRKIALRLHPDKNPDADPAEFVEVARAYEVLSNDNLRKIYDQLGEQGIEAYMQYGSAIPASVYNHLFVLMSCLAMYVLVMLVMWLTFISQKLSGDLDWSWTAVFWPMFMIDALLVIVILLIATSFKKSEGGGDDDIPDMEPEVTPKVLMILRNIFFILSQILLLLKLDASATFSWVIVLVPLFGIWVIACFEAVSALRLGLAMVDQANAQGAEGVPSKGRLVFENFKNIFLWLLQFLLLALKVSQTVEWSWTLVFCPQYALRALYWLIFTILDCTTAKTEEEKSNVRTERMCSLFCQSFFLIFISLAVVTLDQPFTYSPAEIFSPLFVQCGLLILMSCGLCLVACGQMEDKDMPPMDDDLENPMAEARSDEPAGFQPPIAVESTETSPTITKREEGRQASYGATEADEMD